MVRYKFVLQKGANCLFCYALLTRANADYRALTNKWCRKYFESLFMESKINLVKPGNLDQEGKGVQHENQTLKDFNKVNLKGLKRTKKYPLLQSISICLWLMWSKGVRPNLTRFFFGSPWCCKSLLSLFKRRWSVTLQAQAQRGLPSWWPSTSPRTSSPPHHQTLTAAVSMSLEEGGAGTTPK